MKLIAGQELTLTIATGAVAGRTPNVGSKDGEPSESSTGIETDGMQTCALSSDPEGYEFCLLLHRYPLTIDDSSNRATKRP